MADTPDLRHRVLKSGRDCAIRYREQLQLLLQVLESRPADGKQRLVEGSRAIATAVAEIVSAAEALKGNDFIDPEDPTVIAETELLGAAASIEAAAQKLANLRPREITVQVSFKDSISGPQCTGPSLGRAAASSRGRRVRGGARPSIVVLVTDGEQRR